MVQTKPRFLSLLELLVPALFKVYYYFMKWVMDAFFWVIQVVLRSEAEKVFVLLPRRWVVEGTYGWLH